MGVQLYTTTAGPHNAVAGAAYVNLATITDISPGGAGGAKRVGGVSVDTALEVVAWGSFATAGAVSITLGFYWGGVAGVVLAASTSFALPNTASVNWPWKMVYDGRFLAIGSGTSGSINGIGSIDVPSSLTAFAPRRIPETVAGMAVGLDNSVEKTVTVGATWAVAASTSTITCTGYSVRTHG